MAGRLPLDIRHRIGKLPAQRLLVTALLPYVLWLQPALPKCPVAGDVPLFAASCSMRKSHWWI